MDMLSIYGLALAGVALTGISIGVVYCSVWCYHARHRTNAEVQPSPSLPPITVIVENK